MKFSILRNANFIWKFLAVFFCIAAVLIFYHKETYSQLFESGEACVWLPAGTYGVVVDYAGVPEESTVTLTSRAFVTPENEQGTELVVEKLPAGTGSIEYTFSVSSDVRNVSVTSEYVTGWGIYSLKLLNYDSFFLMVLFLMLAGLCLLYGGHYYKKEHNAFLALIGVGILASVPLFNEFFPRSEDMLFHFARVNGIYEGLRTGQFPVRINPVQLEGYGYLSGSMYPQLFLYIPAILKFFHISTLLGVQLLIFASNIATPFFTYGAVRNICHNDRAAFLAAIFYSLNPYRLIDFYSRGALGEGFAMVFLPLILWGTYEILWGRREKWWILTLGMSGVMGAHVLSVELYALFIAGEMVLWVFSRKKQNILKRILDMGKATLSTIVLNLYFIGPFLTFSKLNLKCYAMSDMTDYSLLDIVRAFKPFAAWGSVYQKLGEPGSMSVTLGCAALAGICLFGIILLKDEKVTREEMVSQGKRYLILGSLFLITTLWIFPWKKLMRYPWLFHTLGTIQFAWRCFGVVALLFSIISAIAVTLKEKEERHRYLWPVLLCVLLLDIGGYFSNIDYSAEMIGKMEADASNHSDELYLCENSLPFDYYTMDFAHISCDINEHLIRSGTDVQCMEPQDIVWTNYQKEGLNISADVSAEHDFYACFPLHYYPGYRILVDGVETENYEKSSYLTCDLPQGKHHIDVNWVTPVTMRICDIVSLFAAAGFLLWLLYVRRREKCH